MNLWLPGEGEGYRIVRKVGDGQVHTTIFKMDSQQGSIVRTWNLFNALCGIGRGFRGEWIYACTWLSPFAAHLKLSQCC